MRLEILMAALMVASATTVSSASAAAGQAERVTVCHRTGNKSDAGRFVGHMITIGSSDAVNHIERHGDVKLSQYAKSFFTSSKACLVDNKGNLFTEAGQPVSQTPPAPVPPVVVTPPVVTPPVVVTPPPVDPGGGGVGDPEDPAGNG